MTEARLSERTLLEIADHEGVVLEAYLDSVGVWTWGIGVTDDSGHKVGRYVDNPSTLERALEVYEWLLRTKYQPDVLAAFKGIALKEHQLAAALSFHWNTGAIREAHWVQLFCKGDVAGARKAIMNWSTPREIIGRRKCERDLFFDGRWSSDGDVLVYQVRKPGYQPVKPKPMDLRLAVRGALERAA
ncbi:lysozyme [Croceicoccus naphthovorans]|uniref:lysozyme n=1 Tax=Croceicoccus naphthovorans TaxID=1348774 RepID=UPI00069F2FD7|nr:hypothetical protein [Croceicoccus naphthovorans]MBB3991350.1 GH24 family phage-related lysozyme (muramidase) [Croceicoccus naphthovorans]